MNKTSRGWKVLQLALRSDNTTADIPSLGAPRKDEADIDDTSELRLDDSNGLDAPSHSLICEGEEEQNTDVQNFNERVKVFIVDSTGNLVEVTDPDKKALNTPSLEIVGPVHTVEENGDHTYCEAAAPAGTLEQNTDVTFCNEIIGTIETIEQNDDDNFCSEIVESFETFDQNIDDTFCPVDSIETLEENNNSTSCDGEADIEPTLLQNQNNSPSDGAVAIGCGDGLAQDGENVDRKVKRRKRHQVCELLWTSKKAKDLREKGLPYMGRKKGADNKQRFTVERPGRELNPCNCKCKIPSFQCRLITEDERRKIFDYFWKLKWGERAIYVQSLVTVKLTARARDRKESHESRRMFSYSFFLKLGQTDSKKRVCQKMFLLTLGIGQFQLHKWLKNDTLGESNHKKKPTGRQSQRAKEEKKLESVKLFLKGLPQMESHYCRENTTKLYLEPVWKSNHHVYEVYQEWIKSKGEIPVSTCTFHKVFEDINLALHKPKKDQCDTCNGFRLNHVSDADYRQHQNRKTQARAERARDIASEALVLCVDLQGLLLCPKNNNSLLYYKCKLSVHNFTINNIKTNEGWCFLWSEVEGGLTGNEFSSILFAFVEEQLKKLPTTRHIIIYSDGCNYQNRNNVLSNVLLYLADKHNILIEQKFLEKGHTQNSCDSMHSLISRKVAKENINLPADYIRLICNARQNPSSFEVTYLDHKFFRNFDCLVKIKSIRPGKQVGDPKVVDIRSLKYENGKIAYKLNFEDSYTELQKRESARNSENVLSENIPALYKKRLPIKKTKFNHLQDLKLTIPADYWSFYDKLPHH